MKMFIATILISLLSSTASFAINSKATRENESRNVVFITQLYKEIYEKKEFDRMDKFLSKDVAFYKNFSHSLNYDALKKHLVERSEKCVKINMLPFDNIVASGNKVVTLYTRNCTDKFNNTQKRRIMAITEIDNRKVTRIWIVTHDENEAA